MASMEIDIRDEDPSVLVFSGSSTFELVIGSVSVTMTMEQFDKLCEQMRAWIVEDSPAHTSEARDAARYRWLRDQNSITESPDAWTITRCDFADIEDPSRYWVGTDLDGAIDAAMRQEGGNG